MMAVTCNLETSNISPTTGNFLNATSFITETHVTLQIQNVSLTKTHLLIQEDTDCDGLITIDDQGPKVFVLEIDAACGSGNFKISGNYAVSVLLQELSLAKTPSLLLNSRVFAFRPVERLCSMIRNIFWPSLTRAVDCNGAFEIFKDSKVNGQNEKIARIYVGYHDSMGYQYFKNAARTNTRLQVIKLPEKITPKYIKDISKKPGLLALKINFRNSGLVEGGCGVPYVVPGGRFNEMYGWDSYFIALGLLADGNLELAKSIAENLLFQVENYGKVLNANRSYYLGRSHPPFLTDLIRRIYDMSPIKNDALIEWLFDAFLMAITEYWNVWACEPRTVPEFGLTRYMPESTGVSTETESSHYDAMFQPIAAKAGITIAQLRSKYIANHKKCPGGRQLDSYFRHDQSMRESGHDTTYRLDKVSADLLPVDLNCLLYKYEKDIIWFLEEFCEDGTLIYKEKHQDYILRIEKKGLWIKRALRRRRKIIKLMWNESDGLFYDYNYKKRKISQYKSETAYYALWSGVCSTRQAACLVKTLKIFDMPGGIVSGSQDSLQTQNLSLLRPNRQWDFPYGWAPHQIIIWIGLRKYGFFRVSEKVIYNWLLLITKIFTDYNGTVAEKYDVVNRSHKIDVEYGNVGCSFKETPKEGFGWVNASYLIGLKFLPEKLKNYLGELKEYDDWASEKKRAY